MKYVTWIVIILFLASLVFLGCLIGSRVDYYQYEKHIVSFTSNGIQNGATARYNGICVLVNKTNFEVMCNKLFTINEREKVRRIPVYSNDEAITVKVDDTNYIIIIPVPNSKAVYMETHLDGKKRNFYISDKYRIYERVISYVQPEGFYGPNTLVEEP
ncbi:MAG TPA: hypothetical protein PL054_05785 [Clostridia bacterium]|nr:MAG: hypothetical protein BWX97_01295 [Firmicutes bacterium ADurb.Bin146]HOD93365.1 hypothetical protein [Clostridia bacterium]